jgi:hypothetical protein
MNTKEETMSWKFLGALVATLAFCATLAAQNDPFLGIWELNRAKSPDYPRKSQTIVNAPEPGGFTSRRVTVNQDGTARVEIHYYIFDGKPHQTEGGDQRQISYKRLDANTIERTTDRNGQITVDREEVSQDGQTLAVTQTRSPRVFDKRHSVQ